MLYVFYVDLGKCFQLDVNLINESVLHLKHVIEENYGIAVDKQVLLVSGGDYLLDTQKVCCYNAGTDTNPIYLFNRALLERDEIPQFISDLRIGSCDTEISQIHESIENTATPVTIYTINKINHLAQKYFEHAQEVKTYCEALNTDQLLQQQGLSAAIANVDDDLRGFEAFYTMFENLGSQVLQCRPHHVDLVNRFDDIVAAVAKIPILRALLDENEEERARLESLGDPSNASLLQWISAKHPEKDLVCLKDICIQRLNTYSEENFESLKKDMLSLFDQEQLNELRCTKAITTNLMTLSNLIVTIVEAFEDQYKKSSGIKRNHERLSEVKDLSILPDLVATHRDTLKSMKANYMNLRSCKQLCVQSKQQLCDIIHKKLKTVMGIQKKVADLRYTLYLHSENMKRLQKYIEVIEQLDSAPRNYFAAVNEAVRRRAYSQAFLMWASDLSCKIHTMFTEETERRKKFRAQFDGHFLTALFPGFEDIPPAFATQSPPLFDNNLPALCEDDLRQLSQYFPEMEASSQLPDVDAIRNFFLSKSLTLSTVCDNEDENFKPSSVDDKLAVVMSAAGICKSHDQNHEAMVEEKSEDEWNRENQKNELQIMRESMMTLGDIANNEMVVLKNDLSQIRNYICANQQEFTEVIQKLFAEWQQQQQCYVKDLLDKLIDKDEKIKALYMKISSTESERMCDMGEEEERIQKIVDDAVFIEREKAVKELTELERKHKVELNALRNRFKLMTVTNMERSPSDSSLEKIERGETIEIANHELIVNQLKHDMEAQLNKAIAHERDACEMKLEEELKKTNAMFETEKQLLAESIRRPLMEEFDKQMEMMRLRESSLLSELQRHKDIIHTLTGHEGGSYSLLSRIEDLEKDKNRLQTELIKERTTKYSFGYTSHKDSSLGYDMESSGSSNSLASNSSPELQQSRNRFKERIAYKKGTGMGSHRSQSSKSRPFMYQGVISLQSCNVGDSVLVVWDELQRNYTILQNSSTHHFLHPSSVDQLGLKPASDGSPRTLYCPAEVIEKEYCAPKKTSKRYNLREGERFYRVKVKPLTKERSL